MTRIRENRFRVAFDYSNNSWIVEGQIGKSWITMLTCKSEFDACMARLDMCKLAYVVHNHMEPSSA